MPPFVGTVEERRALALYLAARGGASPEARAAFGAEGDPGAAFFTENCAMCHGPDGEFAFDAKGRTADVLYEMLGRLTAINETMPALEATDEQRHALAEYLATLRGRLPKGGTR
jgi:mono/diheme cytochrome c family protein